MIQFATSAVLAAPSEVDSIGDEIAELVAHLDAATYRLLVLLREFDARNGWGRGFRTCAHWLSWRTGIDLGAAREKMRVARALETLPILSESMRRGTLSYSKARALTRIATPENEDRLHDLAVSGTASHIERIVRAWRFVDRIEESEREGKRHERRGLSVFIDDDGSYVVRGRLDPEAGVLLERALELAAEELRTPDSRGHVSPSQLRADAMGLVAEKAMSGSVRARSDRFQVVVHVDEDALKADGGAGLCELDNGVRVSAETSRRLACDAGLIAMPHGEKGSVLDVGRRTRSVPPALRRALDHRDHGCRFPGCGLQLCDAHHVKHWADGGPTALDNLVLLCRFHHRLLHEDGYTVAGTANGDLLFRTPHGYEVRESPPPRAPIHHDAVTRIRVLNEDDGLDIDEDTAPLWGGDALDLHYTMLTARR